MPRNNTDYRKKKLFGLKFKFLASVWLSFDYAFHVRPLISEIIMETVSLSINRPHLKYLVITQFILDLYSSDAHNIRHSILGK